MVRYDSGERKDPVILGYKSRVEFTSYDAPNGGQMQMQANVKGHSRRIILDLDRRDCIELARVLVAATLNTTRKVAV